MGTRSTWKHRSVILFRLLAKAVFKLLGKRNARLQPQPKYSIKAGYHHAANVELFDDTNCTDEWQRSVYELAAVHAQKLHQPSILDVGCGSGYKLVNLLGQYHTTGIEVDPTYSWLMQKYPDRNWLLFDLTDAAKLHADIVICSDVIEHIRNPDEFMNFLRDIHFKYLILSTPERDAVAGKNDYGPPENTAHYREWNAIEFRTYIQNWFSILEQHVMDDKSVTQVLICTKHAR